MAKIVKNLEKLTVAAILLTAATSCDYRTLDSRSFFDDEDENDGKKQEQFADTVKNPNVVCNNIYVENLEYVDGVKIVDNEGKVVLILGNNGDVIYQEDNCCGDTIVQPLDTIVQDTVKPQPKPRPKPQSKPQPVGPECGCTTKVTKTVKHSVITEYGYQQYCNGASR